MNLTVYKDNDIIRAGYKLSLNEHRLILTCIGQINSSKAIDENDEFCISVDDYAELFSLTKNIAFAGLKDAAEKLYDRSIFINAESLPISLKSKTVIRNGKIKSRWIGHIGFDSEDRKMVLKFHYLITPFLSKISQKFTKYKLSDVSKFTSAHAYRLYELICEHQFKKLNFRIQLNELKEMMQIDDTYKLFGHLNKRVLKPSVEQINKHSNFHVEYKTYKKSRSVTAIDFKLSFKKDREPTKNSAQNPSNFKPSDKEADSHHGWMQELREDVESGMVVALDNDKLKRALGIEEGSKDINEMDYSGTNISRMN